MNFKVDFNSMEWQSRREGARFKLFQAAVSLVVRLRWEDV